MSWSLMGVKGLKNCGALSLSELEVNLILSTELIM